MKIKPSLFATAPDWAQYHTTDSNGCDTWHQYLPLAVDDEKGPGGLWESDGEMLEVNPGVVSCVPICDWRDRCIGRFANPTVAPAYCPPPPPPPFNAHAPEPMTAGGRKPKPKPKQSTPLFADAPEWANWRATNKQGFTHWYACEPALAPDGEWCGDRQIVQSAMVVPCAVPEMTLFNRYEHAMQRAQFLEPDPIGEVIAEDTPPPLPTAADLAPGWPQDETGPKHEHPVEWPADIDGQLHDLAMALERRRWKLARARMRMARLVDQDRCTLGDLYEVFGE